MESYVGPILSLLGVGVSGLIAWVWSLWKAHNELHRKVLEDYVKMNVVQEIRSDVKTIMSMMYRFEAKIAAQHSQGQ